MMKNKLKFYIVAVLLILFITLNYTAPKAKYTGTNFVPQLKMPDSITGWIGQDVSSKVDINYADDNYNFINKILAYNYMNKTGKSLLFIVLDAGNFHNPKVCLTSAGFTIRELDKTILNASGRPLEAHTIYIEHSRKEENYLVLYWIAIDKKIIPMWIEQKIKQLYFSLFNKKRIGLMVRLDIPVEKDNIEDGLERARQFILTISQELPSEKADYLFGRSSL